MTLSDLIRIEKETHDLRLSASIAANRLAAMKVEHKLEKMRLLREKPANIKSLLDRHDQNIKKCDEAVEDLEKAKSSLTDLLEEIRIVKTEGRRPQQEASALQFSIEKLRRKFEEISFKIEFCEELLKMGK